MASKEQKIRALDYAIGIGKEYARSTTEGYPGDVIKDTYEHILKLLDEIEKD